MRDRCSNTRLPHRSAVLVGCCLAIILAFCVSTQKANAGVWVVRDCSPSVGGTGWSGAATYSGTPSNSAFDFSKVACNWTTPLNMYSWVRPIVGRTYSSGDIAAVRWKLPAGLRFAGLKGGVREAWSANGFTSRVQFIGPGAANAVNLNDDLLGHPFYVSAAANRDVFRAFVKCTSATCKYPSTATTSIPHTLLSDVSMVVEDMTSPTVSFGGLSLTTYNSGTKTLSVTGTDNNSGVQSLYALVNGQYVISANNPACPVSYVTSFAPPCGGSFTQSVSVNTTASPWFEGINDLMICANNLDHESSISGVGPYLAYRSASSECSRHKILVLNP